MQAKEMLKMALVATAKFAWSKAGIVIEVMRVTLIAWMVLMTLWGMFSGWWAYRAIQKLDIKIDYMSGTYTVAEPGTGLKEQKGR